jgi:peptidoglycan/xylan/chitin deacetylase (PgdA/CDA1 family)
MSRDGTLILTYHAIEMGSSPLKVSPELLESHLDCILATGAEVLTVQALAKRLAERTLHGQAVALTFDDGLASVVEHAAPLFAQRGLVGTIFCVPTRFGRATDWPSRAPGTPVFPVATAKEIAALAAAGWEVGAHGLRHDPLQRLTFKQLCAELEESRRRLEDATGVEVRTFAFPYGVAPADARRALAVTGYRAACDGRLGVVDPNTDPFALPRVDVHYVRHPALLRRAIGGKLGLYLAARRFGARTRRTVRKDYAAVNADR